MNYFIAEVPVNDPERMKDFQEVMNRIQDETVKYIQNLAQELGVCTSCAREVFYLRTRSRHTQELENRVIAAFKAGHSVVCNGDEEEQLKQYGF